MSRWTYFLKRFLLIIPIFLFAMTGLFILFRAGPLDPVSAVFGQNRDPQDVIKLRRALGLNRPLWQQYIDFMTDLLVFDFGQSWVLYPEQSAKEIILNSLPRTVWLGFWSVVIAIFVGIPLGFYAGLNANTKRDYLASFAGIMWLAMPNFWLAIMILALLSDHLLGGVWTSFLVEIDAVQWSGDELDGIFTDPIQFLQAFKTVFPAALVLGSASMGNEIRISRTAMLENLNSKYVETAKAKGVPRRKIVWKHVFRNALVPLVPIILGELGILLGGAVIVEVLFSINGLGWIFFRSMTSGDLPLGATVSYVFIIIGLLINIFEDFLYTVIDPRVGYEARE